MSVPSSSTPTASSKGKQSLTTATNLPLRNVYGWDKVPDSSTAAVQQCTTAIAVSRIRHLLGGSDVHFHGNGAGRITKSINATEELTQDNQPPTESLLEAYGWTEVPPESSTAAVQQFGGTVLLEESLKRDPKFKEIKFHGNGSCQIIR